MLSTILSVPNVETTNTLVASEDETYLRLLRIPFKEIHARVDEHDMFEDIVRHGIYIDKLNKRERFKEKFRWIFNLLHIKYQTVIYSVPGSRVDFDEKQFERTGWTPESYCVELVRLVKTKMAEERKALIRQFKKKFMWMALSCNIYPWVSFFFGPFPFSIMLLTTFTIGATAGALINIWIK